jgi:hypothetical protein
MKYENIYHCFACFDYYDELPKGKLKVTLSSDFWIYGETKEWTLGWQP